jgi:chromosome segregation ATPase
MGTALALYAYPEESDMEPPKTPDLATQVAELRSDVRHVQSDITDIKSDIREIKTDIKAMDLRLTGEIKGLDQRLSGDIRAQDLRLSSEMKTGFEKLDLKIDKLKDSLASAKIWALGMYITLAGSMLYVIAKSAKWF